jgi:ADP-heptose:LPS heptosyltransferase
MISIGAARFLDRYAGFFACLLLSGFRRRVRRPLPEAPSKILVLKFWEGGLIVMGAPWYRALRRRYPASQIHFLTLDVNAQLAGMLGAANKVLPLRVSAGLAGFFYDLLRVLPALRAEKYDLVLDLEFLSRFSAILTGLTGAGCAAGFSGEGVWRGSFHDIEVPLRLERHMTENYAEFFGAVGAWEGEGDDRPLKAAAEVPGAPGPGVPFVVLNFDRKDIMPERAWPRGHYETLLTYLLDRGGYEVVAISQRRVELPERPHLVNLSGGLDYPQLAGLFSRAALFVTHDSGPLHIAAAMGCRTISIFGPETPSGYAPLGPKHKALYLGLPCSPCVNALKGKELHCVRSGNDCVTGVTPAMVIKAMEEMLAAAKPAAAEPGRESWPR